MHLCYVKLLGHCGMNIIMKANTCTEHSCFLWILALECHSKLAGPKTTLINIVSNCKRKVDLKIQIVIHYSDIIMSAMASEITSPAPDCLLGRLFRRRLKKTSKLRVTGHCAGNSQVTCEFPAQRASNAENVSIWWRHRAKSSPRNGCQANVQIVVVKSLLPAGMTVYIIPLIYGVWNSHLYHNGVCLVLHSF